MPSTLIWVGLSFDDANLVTNGREMAQVDNAYYIRFTDDFWNTKEFKETLKQAQDEKASAKDDEPKMDIIFSGHADREVYGESNLSPIEFCKKIDEIKVKKADGAEAPCIDIRTIYLHGCMIGLADKDPKQSYLYRFAEELYKDPAKRKIKVKAVTRWGLTRDEDIDQMIVWTGLYNFSVGILKGPRASLYRASLAKHKADHAITDFYASKYQEVIYENKMNIREALDNNPNFVLTYDMMEKIKSFDSDRFKAWVDVNEAMAKKPSALRHLGLNVVRTALENRDIEFSEVLRMHSNFLKTLAEKKKAERGAFLSRFERWPSYYLKMAVDLNLVDEIKQFDPNLPLGPDSKCALLYAMEKKQQDVVQALLKNGADPLTAHAKYETPLAKALVDGDHPLAVNMLLDVSDLKKIAVGDVRLIAQNCDALMKEGSAIFVLVAINLEERLSKIIPDEVHAYKTKWAGYYLRRAIDYDLNHSLATLDPNLLLPPDSKCALLYALEKKKDDAVSLLLDRGADPLTADAKHGTPLANALISARYDFAVRMLLSIHPSDLHKISKNDLHLIAMHCDELKKYGPALEKCLKIITPDAMSARESLSTGGRRPLSHIMERHSSSSFRSQNEVTEHSQTQTRNSNHPESHSAHLQNTSQLTHEEHSEHRLENYENSQAREALNELAKKHPELFIKFIMTKENAVRCKIIKLLDPDIITLLSRQTFEGHKEFIALLLEAGIDPSRRTEAKSESLTTVEVRPVTGNPQAQARNPNRPESHSAPLQSTSQSTREEHAKHTLKNYENPQAKEALNELAKKHPELFIKFIMTEENAVRCKIIKLLDPDIITLLSRQTFEGRKEFIAVLLEAGIDPSRRTGAKSESLVSVELHHPQCHYASLSRMLVKTDIQHLSADDAKMICEKKTILLSACQDSKNPFFSKDDLKLKLKLLFDKLKEVARRTERHERRPPNAGG
jgi:hypothetical protein